MEEIIEEERAKVDAKTPITNEVFQMWKAERVEAKRKAAEEKEEERRKKGILTGREIFAQEGFIAQDDVSASDTYVREVDEEAEIMRVHEAAQAALEHSKLERVEPPETVNGASGETGEGDGVVLTAQEEEELFEEDDDEDALLDALTEDLAQPGTLRENA